MARPVGLTPNSGHHHIERDNLLFALTGSSARKLRRAQANMLAGRAASFRLYPLTHRELGVHFSLDHALRWGGLPRIINSADEATKAASLRAYAQTYLQEEIVAEQIVRKLTPFRKFLRVAAQCNGTLIQHSFRKRLRHQPKFYFFDTGAMRALAGTLEVPLVAGTSAPESRWL